MPVTKSARIAVAAAIALSAALGQPVPAPRPAGSAPPVLTFADALARALAIEPQYLQALNAASLAHEDAVQARAARYPVAGIRSDYLNTQGNGLLPSGRFVTNDGCTSIASGRRFTRIFRPALLPGSPSSAPSHWKRRCGRARRSRGAGSSSR